MRVLVTFAVDAEFAPWRKLRRFEKLATSGTECHSTRVGDAEINVLLTGVGGKKTWVEAAKILWDTDIDICISSGLAGSLKSTHQPGDVLAAESIQAVHRGRTIFCDPALVRVASNCGAKVVRSFYSSDHVVIRAQEKQQLGLRADAVEMESGEVLHQAAGFGAKGIAVRGVSDGADEDLPLDFNRVTTDSGDVSFKRVLGQVAKNVAAIPSLIRFGQQSRLAAEKLTEFLDLYLIKLISAKSAVVEREISKA
jgi:adenosylhomocysteine nucleosidase